MQQEFLLQDQDLTEDNQSTLDTFFPQRDTYNHR